MKICPKCDYQRIDTDYNTPDYECPKCGVIYDKAKQKTIPSPLISEKSDNIFKRYSRLGSLQKGCLGCLSIFILFFILAIVGGIFVPSRSPKSYDKDVDSIPGMSGPFGLKMGMSLKEIGGDPKEIGRGRYIITNVPKPHSAFAEYAIIVAPKCGLGKIVARGEIMKTSVYGTDLENEFDTMEKKLEASYGKHSKHDFLKAGSIWREPNEWMMALKKKERVLLAGWTKEGGSSLSDDIAEIILETCALSEKEGFIMVSYYFSNSDACLDEIDAQEDGAL